MKHTLKGHNRVLAVLLAIALMVSMIPMGLALAEDVAYPVVVDSSFTGEAGTLVDYDAAGYTAADLATYATLTEAMTALGTNGGKVWIKGSYTASSKSELNGVADRGLVIIAGFNDTQSGNVFVLNGSNNSTSYEISIKGDLTFENIELTLYSVNAAANYFNYASYGFYSYGYKLTFGTGVKFTNDGTRIGPSYNATNNKGGEWVNDVDLKSGNYYSVAPLHFQFNSNNYAQIKNGSIRYSIYDGANVKYVLGRPVIGGGYPAGYRGDYEVNIYGGTVTNVCLGSYFSEASGKPNYLSVIDGNTTFNIQGGNVRYVFAEYASNSGTNAGYYSGFQPGNLTVIINGNKSSATTVKGGSTSSMLELPEGKYFTVIVNNAEGGMGIVDTANETFANIIDYNIQVRNGKAEPVYDSSKNITGFKVTPDVAGYPILIDGVKATPVEGTTDVYAITPKGAEVINISVDIDYKVVLGAEGTEVNGDEKLFTNFAGAAAYLGAEGGTIYVRGEVTIDSLVASAEHGLITIKGYGDTAEDNVLTVTNMNAVLKGDVTFKNVNVVCGSAIYTGPKTLTFGEGTVSNNVIVGKGSSSRDINIVFDSEFVSMDKDGWATISAYGTNNIKTNINITLNNGYLSTGNSLGIILGSYANNTGDGQVVNGDQKFTINGGTIGDIWLGHRGEGKKVTVMGNTIVNINGGVSNTSYQMNFGVLGKADVYMHNIAVTYNEATMTDIIKLRSSGYAKLNKYNDTSKWIIIYNNQEKELASAENNSTELCDYYIWTYGGKAEAVFSERTDVNDASTSVLLGFKLTADTEGYVPTVGGVVLDKAEGKDYYDLSAFANGTAIEVVFAEEVATGFQVGEEIFASLEEAIAALNGAAGTITVVGEQTVATLAAAAHGDIIITGDALTVTSGSAAFGGNITFKNINVSLPADLVTGGKTLTLGEGTTGSWPIAPSALGSNIVLDTDGMTLATVNGKNKDIQVLYSQSNAIGDFNFVLKNGTLNHVFLGAGNGCAGQINGNITFTMNGGLLDSRLYVGGYAGTGSANRGNTLAIVNGGTLAEVSVGPMDATKATQMHNMALIINNSDALEGTAAAINIATRKQAMTKLNANSKWMVIINNYEEAKFTFEEKNESRGYFYTRDGKVSYLDYFILTTGTTVNPVFSAATGDDVSTSVFEGFEITVAEGKVVVVNGEVVEAKANGLYDLSKFSGQKIEVSLAAAKDLESTKETVTGTKLDAYKNGEVPAKEGYLFGGFIGEDGKALKADEIANAESLTVKFIPKAVLDIGWQIRQNDNTVDLRLISTVDSLEYSAVTFIVKVAGRDDMVLTSKKVYTKIAGYKDGENVQYAPTAFSAASEYFMTHVITGIPAGFHGTDFTVTANLLTKDGKTITGDAITFQIEDHADYTAIVE